MSEIEVAPKKTVRKTASKTAVAKSAAKPRTRRTNAVREKDIENTPPPRRAPTTLVSPAVRSKNSRLPLFIGLGFVLLVSGISIAVGMQDSGAIVVADELERRINEAGSDEERQAIENVTLPKPADLPLGGLVGMGDTPALEPQTEIAPASSTDQTATGTDTSLEAAAQTTPGEPATGGAGDGDTVETQPQ